MLFCFFAGPNCDVGKEYQSCGTEENTRSCYNKTTDIEGTDSICRPGCYCKSGLIMDGDKCIEPEQCGCLYNDFYYSVSIKKNYLRDNCIVSENFMASIGDLMVAN